MELTAKTLYKRLMYLILILSLQSCVYVKYHAYAPTEQSEAEMTIKKLINDTLLVVIPTHQDKERILMASTKRTKLDREKQKQKLLNLYAERQIEQEAIIAAFTDNYTFSKVLFIPDSLVTEFEAGERRSFFINQQNEIDPTLTLANRAPIKLVKQFDQEWQIKVRNTMIPNPFPNYYIYRNGLFGFLGSETYVAMYSRVAGVFQRRFEAFHADPDSRVIL